MYIIIEHRLRDYSRPYEMDQRHSVALRYLSSDYDRAFEYYSELLRQYPEMEVLDPHGHALMRAEELYGRHEIALLDVPEDQSVSVLACPVIQATYVE